MMCSSWQTFSAEHAKIWLLKTLRHKPQADYPLRVGMSRHLHRPVHPLPITTVHSPKGPICSVWFTWACTLAVHGSFMSLLEEKTFKVHIVARRDLARMGGDIDTLFAYMATT